jgi:hypothetical protein
MRKGTTEWTILQQNFVVTFSFDHDNPDIDSYLKMIYGMIFFEEPEVEIITKYQQQNTKTIKYLLSCYHVAEDATDEDDPHNIQIIDIEG